METIVIIPAYNEQTTIGGVVDSLKKLDFVSEVVVVDDGSCDQTGKEAAERGATALRHIINRGYGAALTTGTHYALRRGAEIIVHFDADGQFTAGEIKEIIKPLREEEAEVVIGSRFLGKKANTPLGRLIFLRMAVAFNRCLTGVYLTDAHNGFRALNRRAAQCLKLRQDGMAYCTELLTELRKNRLKYKEIPVTVRYTAYSRQKGQNSLLRSFEVIRDLLLKN